MTQEEFDAIEPMTNEEIEEFKNRSDEDTEDATVEELQERLNEEERRIVSLMKRIIIDVAKYNDYQPLEEFITALKNSKYFKDKEYKRYIANEGKKSFGEGYEYIKFLKVIEELFEDDYDDEFI